jgi:hypothetical protein
MDGSTLSTFIDELNGGASIGTTLKFELVIIAKAIIERIREVRTELLLPSDAEQIDVGGVFGARHI